MSVSLFIPERETLLYMFRKNQHHKTKQTPAVVTEEYLNTNDIVSVPIEM